MTQTVFYILSGDRYITEARVSAQSIRRHMPNVQRWLFTPDEGIERGGEFDQVCKLPPRQHEQWLLDGVRYLCMALERLPKQVIWLDCDVYACMPFPELFDMTDRFDLTGTHSPGRRTAHVYRYIPMCFPEMVTGVNSMRNGRALQEFVKYWYELHVKHLDVYGDNDQASLREALWTWGNNTYELDDGPYIHSFIQYYLMPPEWNLRLVSKDGHFIRDRVRFLHGRHPDLEGLAQSVNREEGMRVWKPG